MSGFAFAGRQHRPVHRARGGTQRHRGAALRARQLLQRTDGDVWITCFALTVKVELIISTNRVIFDLMMMLDDAFE